jgi:hypothetical protein
MQTETEAPPETTLDTNLDIVDDFSDLDTKTPSEQGRPLYLRNPKTGKQLGCPDGSKAFITFVGPDSDSVRKVQRRNRDEQTDVLGLGNGKASDPDAKEKRDLDDIASFVRGWNLPPIDGKVREFKGLADAKLLLGDIRFKWISEQAFLFVHTRERFFAEASSN